MWTRTIARDWYSRSKSEMHFLLRGLTFAQPREVEWFSPRLLPRAYRDIPCRPKRCLQAAVDAVRLHPELRPVAGFSFRPQVPDRGIEHVFALDRDGHPVDPAAERYGPPEGYLGVVLKPDEIHLLGRLNGL